MKIGILTFHDTTNFGSLLQTYGLYKKISDFGYDCDIINYQCENIVKREIPQSFKFTLNLKQILKEVLLVRIKRKKYKALSMFLHSHMSLSDVCNKNSIYKQGDKYDKIIIGSDIVWGLDITNNDTTYFLDFVKEKNKKYAFSSSIGNPWSEQEKQFIKPLLQDFAYIAVREDESADWVEELTGMRPDVVCDPTMLINSSEWLKHTYTRKDKDKYVLVYFDNKNKDCLKSAIRYAEKYNLKVKYINYGFPKKGVCNVKPISLEDFLSLINDAAKVITASYHGMLFSIYFNKQFVYFNRAHKSRMNTLARKLQVQNCDGEGKDILNMPTLNYEVVNKAVEEYRIKSIDCLKKILI